MDLTNASERIEFSTSFNLLKSAEANVYDTSLSSVTLDIKQLSISIKEISLVATTVSVDNALPSENDAIKIVTILDKEEYKNIFIDRMVNMELGLDVPNKDYKSEIKKQGLITFISFIIFGSIPIFIYIISYWSNYNNYNNIFYIDCFITLLTIINLGYYQAKITKNLN